MYAVNKSRIIQLHIAHDASHCCPRFPRSYTFIDFTSLSLSWDPFSLTTPSPQRRHKEFSAWILITFCATSRNLLRPPPPINYHHRAYKHIDNILASNMIVTHGSTSCKHQHTQKENKSPCPSSSLPISTINGIAPLCHHAHEAYSIFVVISFVSVRWVRNMDRNSCTFHLHGLLWSYAVYTYRNTIPLPVQNVRRFDSRILVSSVLFFIVC